MDRLIFPDFSINGQVDIIEPVKLHQVETSLKKNFEIIKSSSMAKNQYENNSKNLPNGYSMFKFYEISGLFDSDCFKSILHDKIDSIKNSRERNVKVKFQDRNIILNDYPEFFNSLKSFIKSNDAWDFLETLEGRYCDIKQASVTITTADDTCKEYPDHFKNAKLKNNFSFGKSYLHIDSQLNVQHKLLIYLTDVQSDLDGPFRIVNLSPYEIPLEELALMKTLDQLKLPHDIFCSLPSAYRKHALIGNMDWVQENYLDDYIANEIPVFSDSFHGFVFNNNYLHRGGFVIGRDRVLLQITVK